MKLVITGGHHSSALPVIKLLRNKHPDVEIVWIGHRYSQKGNKEDTLEYREITAMEIPFYDLKAGKFYKFNSISHLIKLPLGFFKAVKLIKAIKPDVVLSFGGYLAAPVVFASWLFKIPAITHEQTVVVGYSNKFISRFVNKVLISWEESGKYFPSSKVVFSGLPVRKEIFDIRSSSFELDNGLPFILVLGGKTGSHFLNKLIEANLEILLSFSNLIHQTGDHTQLKDFERLSNKYSQISKKVFGAYFPRKFIFEDEIGEAFGRADLVLARSGAHTINELKLLNKKCILFPIPWVSHNEQFLNAKILEEKGLGVILNEDDVSNEFFIDTVKNLLKDPKGLDFTKEAIINKETINLPEEIIVDEIFKITKKKDN